MNLTNFVIRNPTLTALLYDPSKALGQRWSQLATSTIPRLYHSVALLLLDGTVLVAGSNPNEMPVLAPKAGAPYQTEFRVERYTPPYLTGANAAKRPTSVSIPVKSLAVNASYTVSFTVPITAKAVKIVLYHGGFVTHSVHMGHRMMILDNTGFKAGVAAQTMTFNTPPTKNTCPPGPYVLYVVVSSLIFSIVLVKYTNNLYRLMAFLPLVNSSLLFKAAETPCLWHSDKTSRLSLKLHISILEQTFLF